MKNSLLTVALVFNATLHARAQTNFQEVIMHKKISAQDSSRLMHYLIGYGLFPGNGQFVNDRKVYLDSALSVVPFSAFLWFQKAYSLLFAKKYEIGMPFLDSAVKYDREGYIGYRGYMKCIFQKHCRESIADLKTAQQLSGKGDVEDHTYDFYIGLCYLQLNEFDSSERLFENSINEVRKNNGWQSIHYLDWFYLGITLFEKNDFNGAYDCFDSCLHIYPKFSDAKFYKSWCLTELHQYKPALGLISEANNDFDEGYTINEDNARLEQYPYQVNKYILRESLEILTRKNDQK